ncbi:MAG TPA: methionine--tRNA ligase [Candidatus Peribacteria bacterium]|nr:methionine--tRNA ligase [Candidatus Peribacteria bacterium]
MSSRQYVTTAIDYPNAAPHMGHALEKILADVTARWFRLRGDQVRFQIGTDEHGIKIQQTAEREKITPKQLVDRNVPLFQELYKRLNISCDLFMRTSDQQLHWPTVTELWKKLKKAEMLEKRTYVGLYCSGCERFITKKELVDGMCDIHKRAPEEVKEENWFYKMSKDTANLRDLLTGSWDKEQYRIVPKYRENETLALLDQGLEDVSFSRPKSSLSWGVPVPDDADQVMYVWCDALTNYISGIGLLTDHAQPEWWNDAQVTHVIGKDIARFHALIWPSMLKHAGIRTPDQLLIHGFLTSEGEKMSKSLGNVVVPDDVISKYGVDALRFYLSHEIPVGNDGDFSWKRFGELYDAKLRNQLGNMLNRVLVLLKKDGGVVKFDRANPQAKALEAEWQTYAKAMDAHEVHAGVQVVTNLISVLNGAFNDAAPWKLKEDHDLRISTLGAFSESLRHAALMLLPFMPDTAQKISRQLGVPYAESMLEKSFVITPQLRSWGGAEGWNQSGEPSILFAPVEVEAAK